MFQDNMISMFDPRKHNNNSFWLMCLFLLLILKVASARGPSKDPFLDKFLIFQMRQKDTDESKTTSKIAKTAEQKKVTREWMTAEIMDQTKGSVEGASWRASGEIPHRPFAMTGRDDDAHR